MHCIDKCKERGPYWRRLHEGDLAIVVGVGVGGSVHEGDLAIVVGVGVSVGVGVRDGRCHASSERVGRPRGRSLVTGPDLEGSLVLRLVIERVGGADFPLAALAVTVVTGNRECSRTRWHSANSVGSKRRLVRGGEHTVGGAGSILPHRPLAQTGVRKSLDRRLDAAGVISSNGATAMETPLKQYMGADANAKNTHNNLDNTFIL